MKITKRQLKRIIKEEKSRLNEGFKEIEMELVDEIVDLLIERGAVRLSGPDDNGYADSAEYLSDAIIPALQSLGA